MTASANIKTPAMDVPLLPMEEARKKGEYLKKQFTRVHLSDVSSEFYCTLLLLYALVTVRSCSLSVLYVYIIIVHTLLL